MSLPKRGRDEAFILRTRDHSVLPLRVEREEALAAITEPVNGNEIVVWKHGPGWTRPNGSRMFLTTEGQLIVNWITEENSFKEAPLPDFLRFLLDDYDKLLPELREKFEKNNYAATVTVEPIDMDDTTFKEFNKVKAEEYLTASSLRQLNTWGTSEPEIDKTDLWISRILFLLTGAFGMYFFINWRA